MCKKSEKIMFREIMEHVDKFDKQEMDFVEFLEEKIEFYSSKNDIINPIEDYKKYLEMVMLKGYPDFKYLKQYHKK
jgi:hypothetical protein